MQEARFVKIKHFDYKRLQQTGNGIVYLYRGQNHLFLQVDTTNGFGGVSMYSAPQGTIGVVGLSLHDDFSSSNGSRVSTDIYTLHHVFFHGRSYLPKPLGELIAFKLRTYLQRKGKLNGAKFDLDLAPGHQGRSKYDTITLTKLLELSDHISTFEEMV